MAKVNDVHIGLKREVNEDKQKGHEHTHTHNVLIISSVYM